MLANDLVAQDDIQSIVLALGQVRQRFYNLSFSRLVCQGLQVWCAWSECGLCKQVERLRDEGVQLKILQTALTLMQSPLLAEDEVRIDPAYQY